MIRIHRRVAQLVTLATTVVALFVTIQCGGSSSTSPTTTTGVSAVTLAATSVSAGASGQGTVSITTAAPAAGVSISLSSSNPAVATVPATVAIVAGASSATFTVTGVSAGTATIAASLNGTSMQSAALTVTGRLAALASIVLNATTVVGGNNLGGTVTLTAPAPAVGASVSLIAVDPVVAPTVVVVPAGAMSATFTLETRAVAGTVSTTISGSYGGASASAILSVTRPTVAIASFGVSGPTETETCALSNNGATLNCTFNGSTSSGPGAIVAWDWTYGVSTMFSQTTTGPVLTMPNVNCAIMPAPPLPAGNPWFTMIVTLKVHDNLGNVSAVTTDAGARLFPNGTCGF